MATFKVTYSDGTEKVETSSDCPTVELFMNSRFGTGSGRENVKVELEGEIEVKVEPAPKAKAKK